MRKRRRIIEEAEETLDKDNIPLAHLLENETDDEYCEHTDGMEEDLTIIDGDTIDTESFCVVEYRLRETDKNVFYINVRFCRLRIQLFRCPASGSMGKSSTCLMSQTSTQLTKDK